MMLYTIKQQEPTGNYRNQKTDLNHHMGLYDQLRSDIIYIDMIGHNIRDVLK